VAAAFALAASLFMLFRASDALVYWCWTASALVPVAGLLSALLLRPSELEAVRVADRRLDLHQQLGTAHELLRKNLESTLAPWQLALASDLAGNLPLARAFPLLPKREVLVALVLSAATGGVLFAVSLGVSFSNPLQNLSIPGITKEPGAPTERPLFGDSRGDENSGPRSAALESTRQMLSQIQRQAQRGTLSGAAAANALSQASNELNRAAQESLIRQEALDKLATELRGTAAGNEIAQTLRQGDYERASEQIRELGRQTDQLSQSAKEHLSQALGNAASQTQDLQQLSRAENRASQSLQKPHSGETTSSMDRLAQAVEEAGRQVVPQSELAETWQQMDDLNRQLAGGDGSQNGDASEAPRAAGSPNGAGEKSSSLQPGSPSGGQQSDGDGASGAPGERGGQLRLAGGAAGNTPRAPLLGDPNAPQGTNGASLEIQGGVSDQFSNELDTGSQPPSVMREGDANSTASGTGGQGEGAVSVPAENVFVPGDRRSIVRDYFSDK